MKKAEQEAYNKELRRVTKQLDLPHKGNAEEAIIHYCEKQIHNWIKIHGQPQNLTELLELFAPSLDMKFEEIYDEIDLDRVLKTYPPEREPIMVRLNREFDDDTDAITVLRSYRELWEPPFLSIINCQGWHIHRKYFTKWHEAVHRIIEGQQLRLAFRRTSIKRRDPQEILVDRVAGSLAFYRSIFDPIFQKKLKKFGLLSFEGIDEIREIIAPDASRQATALACLRLNSSPLWFIQSGLGYRRSEEFIISGPQASFLSNPTPKLRVRESACSPAAESLGIRIHKNMRVPNGSIVSQAFNDPFPDLHVGTEPIEMWETSSGGPIGYGNIHVEAVRFGDDVWSLLHILSE